MGYMAEKKLSELKKESKLLNPVVRIGKNGLSENIMKEIKILLKKRGLIKIKMLKNCSLGIDETIEHVKEGCNCMVVDRIGLTFSIYRGKSL
jgi:RNA-binding protein